jgi:hypothetical protein
MRANTRFFLSFFTLFLSCEARRFVEARSALVSQPTQTPVRSHLQPHNAQTTPLASSPAEMHELLRRAMSPTTAVVDGYTQLGCFQDGSDNVLAVTRKFDNGMTPELCRNVCSLAKCHIFGLENGYHCYCDTTIANFAVSAQATECSVGCWGSSAAVCGAGNRINIYSATAGPFSGGEFTSCVLFPRRQGMFF